MSTDHSTKDHRSTMAVSIPDSLQDQIRKFAGTHYQPISRAVEMLLNEALEARNAKLDAAPVDGGS